MNWIDEILDNWIKNDRGEPLFKDSLHAAYYGAIISDRPAEIEKLKDYRAEAYRQIALEKLRVKPNAQRICNLATKAQLFREAYEEAERIVVETIEGR